MGRRSSAQAGPGGGAQRCKVLFLSGAAHRALDPNASRASGGAELQVALLARELAARGLAVTLAAADDGFADGVVWNGVRVRATGRFDTGHPGDALRTLPRLLAVLREEVPDRVVVYGWTAWLAVLAVLRPLFGYKLVFVCALDSEIDGGFEREHPVRGRLFAWGMRAADVHFAITEAQAALFSKRGMRVTVLRLLLAEKPSPHPLKEWDLLWVARCHPAKRPALFLDLAARVPSARCCMICSPQDPTLFAHIQKAARELPNVTFLEGVPYREIQSWFDRARVFVNTSNDEGVPNTFLHAALGRAAIASLQADPDRLIQRFGAGVCAGGGFEDLVRGVQDLLGCAAALEDAADGAARCLREWHQNDRNVDIFLEGLRV